MNEQKKFSVKYWPFLILIPALILAWRPVFSQYVQFHCEKGVCVASEADLDKFQEFLNQVGARLIGAEREVESLRKENETLKKRVCA